MEHDSVPVQRQKQLVFWTVYTILNMMSLRLGRACPIQNYDISLPMPVAENLDVLEPWAPVCVLWTRSAIIQSKIYQYLYSPEALQQPESHRVTHAQKLAAEMKSSIMEPFEVYRPADGKLIECANTGHTGLHGINSKSPGARHCVPYHRQGQQALNSHLDIPSHSCFAGIWLYRHFHTRVY